jgi:Phage capsid family
MPPQTNAEKQRIWQSRHPKRPAPRPEDSFVEAAVAVLYGKAHDIYPDAVAAEHFSKNLALPGLLLKAATSPTTSVGYVPDQLVANFIGSLHGQSAGAAALAMGLQLPASGGLNFGIPHVVTTASANFVAENAPIPVKAFTTAAINLELKKLAGISTYTRELFNHSIPAITAIVRDGINTSMALTIDGAMFSADAGDSTTKPPGLLHGISAGSESDNTDLQAAMFEDLATLISGVSGVAGSSQIVIVAGSAQGRRLKLHLVGHDDPGFTVLISSAVSEKTLIAIATNTLASTIDNTPRLDVSSQAVLNYDDSAPQDISNNSTMAGGSTRSSWQADILALKMVIRLAWGLRSASGLAWLEDTIW